MRKLFNFIGEEESSKLTKLTAMLSNMLILSCIKYTKSNINLAVSQYSSDSPPKIKTEIIIFSKAIKKNLLTDYVYLASIFKLELDF